MSILFNAETNRTIELTPKESATLKAFFQAKREGGLPTGFFKQVVAFADLKKKDTRNALESLDEKINYLIAEPVPTDWTATF